MDDLHDAIAAFLRAQRPAAPGAGSAPRTPHPRAPRAFWCRFCAARVVEAEPGDRFHFGELWEAVSCEWCHARRLAREATDAPLAVLRQALHRASDVTPRCRHCGQPVRDGDGRYPVEELRAARVCADCRAAGR